MRVTTSMIYQNMVLDLNQKIEDNDRLSNMIASGKRISTPQEDPQAWSHAMDLKQGLREIGTFQKNVDFASSWNQTTLDALSGVSDLLGQAIKAGQDAANNSGDRTTQINIIDSISKQVLDLANTQYQDLYIFSGRSFSTPPFDATTLNYQGGTETDGTRDFQVRVGKNNLQTINIDGESAFQDPSDPGGLNILQRLQALKTALETPGDTTVQDQITALESAQKYVQAESSLAGLRLSYLDGQKSSLTSLNLNETNQLSALEDTNSAEAITQMQQNQTALQAALQVTAMLKDLSLVNFL